MEDTSKGYLLILFTIFIHSFAPIALKFSFNSTNPLTTQMLWFIVAFFWAIVVAIILKKKNIVSQIKKHWKILLFFALTNVVGNIALFYSVDILGPSWTVFLDKSDVIFAVLFGVLLLNEKFNLKEALGLIISVIGIILLTFTREKIQLNMALIYLAGLVIYTYGFIIVKKNIKNIDPFSFMFVRTFVIGVVVSIITISTNNFVMPDLPTWKIISFMPLFTAVIAQITQFTAYKYVDVGKATVVKNLSPFLVMAWSFIAFGEILSGRQIIGGVIIIIGVTIMIIFKDKKQIIETIAEL